MMEFKQEETQQQQKRHLNPMRRSQRKTYRGEKNHTQRGETTIERSEQTNKKCIWDQKRAKRQEEILRILEDFKGIKSIPGIKSAKRRVLTTKIKNEKGEVITSRKGIANAFGEFYKQFYDDQEHEGTEQENEENENESSIDVQNKDTSEMMRILEITTEELQTAINRLKKGKSADSNGIRAEDIKACDDETNEMVRQIFNEIVKQNEFTPEAWRKVRIKVIHKKGDVEDVGNHRPICSLPALYKLFTTILYSR